jgi:hypothetical protein
MDYWVILNQKSWISTLLTYCNLRSSVSSGLISRWITNSKAIRDNVASRFWFKKNFRHRIQCSLQLQKTVPITNSISAPLHFLYILNIWYVHWWLPWCLFSWDYILCVWVTANPFGCLWLCWMCIGWPCSDPSFSSLLWRVRSSSFGALWYGY